MTTPLPETIDFNGVSVTEGGFKAKFAELRQYLADLLGVAGTPVAARKALGVRGNEVVTKTADYTAVASDCGKVIRFTSGSTLSLTATATLGNGWTCGVVNDTGADFTIDPSASETIDGATTYVLPAAGRVELVCNGAAFYLATSVSSGKIKVSANDTAAGFLSGKLAVAGGLSISEVNDGADEGVLITGPGAWEKVSSNAISAVATIDLDLQEDVFCEWLFVIEGAIPATDGAHLELLFGYGGTYVAPSAGSYGEVGTSVGPGTALYGSANAGRIATNAGSAAGESVTAHIKVGGIRSGVTGGAWYCGKTYFLNDTGARLVVNIDGYYVGVARAFDALRFDLTDGSFEAAGTVTMYGLRR